MSLGDLLKYYGTYQKLSVFELGGAPLCREVIACEISMSFLSREVVRFYPDCYYICVTIEED